MCRKLTLTGWVLMIRGDGEEASVIVALFVTITFFGLTLRLRPLRRCAVCVVEQACFNRTDVFSDRCVCPISWR
jgi:hypothetical protein